MSELHNLSVKALATLLQTKEVSAVEVATRFLARMGGNPHNAFLDIDSEVTLAQAQASDAKLADGTAGPLDGVPVAAGARPAATAAALPPDEPPGTRAVSQGLVTAPKAEFSLAEPMANSSQLSLPNVTMPAERRRCTTVASNGER